MSSDEGRYNELIRRFGDAVKDFLTVAAKKAHASDTFDMRRRTLMGNYTFYDNLPWLIDQMAGKGNTPEDLAGKGKQLCGVPKQYQIQAMIWSYLLARENELALGRDGGPEEDLKKVIDWWERMILTYREGSLTPYEADHTQRVVGDRTIAEALDTLGRPIAEDPDYGKITAALQVFNYVQHGEQRGTTFFHGPYRPTEGTTAFVEEFSRLLGDELPWSADPSPFPVDDVCAVVETEGADFAFDLFQGMSSDPADYHSLTRRVALLSCDAGELKPLTAELREQIVTAAAVEQKRLFREMLEWDDEFKIKYGVYLYLKFYNPVLMAAGFTDEELEQVRRRFEVSADSRVEEVAEVDPVPVWQRLYESTGEYFFTPLGGGSARRS